MTIDEGRPGMTGEGGADPEAEPMPLPEAGAPEQPSDSPPAEEPTDPPVEPPVEPPAAAVPPLLATPTARQDIARRAARSRRGQRVMLPTALTLVLFIAGIAFGVGGEQVATAGPPPSAGPSFPSLADVPEPPVAAFVTQLLSRNDPKTLSEALAPDILDAINRQLTPFVVVDRIQFAGATALADEILSSYVVHGRDNTGGRGIVGLILVVRNGEVVAQ